MERTPGQILEAVAAVLDDLNIPYLVGGSFASIAYGTHRTTQDVDFVVDIRLNQADSLVEALKERFYISDDAVREGIRRRGMFNAIHYETSFKVDFYVLKEGAYDRVQFERRGAATLDETSERMIMMASPEDTVVKKLEWYKLGECISERQWNDVIGVMKVQGERLDEKYMREWADKLGIADLLEKALTEAGL